MNLVADKEITNLPASQDVTDETLFVVYQPGEMEPAQKVSAEQLKQYTNENIAVTADNIKKALGYTPADTEKTVGVETKTFSDAQKEQARKNIGAVGFGQLPDIVCTAQGEVISLSDSSDRELKGLRIFGKTTQEGTPSPEAPVPLESVGDDGSVDVTVAGNNLIDPANFSATTERNGISFINHGDGSFSLSGTATAETSIYIVTKAKAEPFSQIIRQGGMFSLSCDKAVYHIQNLNLTIPCLYDGGISYITVTGTPRDVPVGAEVTGVLLWVPAGATVTTVDHGRIWLERGNATEYEPYKPAQTLSLSTPNGLPGIPVSEGGNYTDENGKQWVCDEVDFARGVYVQRVRRDVYTGNEIWQLFWDTPGMFALVNAHIDCALATDQQIKAGMCCNSFEIEAYNQLRGHLGDSSKDGMVALSKSKTASTFVIAHYACTTVAEFKEFLSQKYENGTPVECLFILATPIETDLIAEELAQYAALHTNYPNTTIFNDGGAGMEVSYVADTKLYIDNKFAELAAAFVNNA